MKKKESKNDNENFAKKTQDKQLPKNPYDAEDTSPNTSEETSSKFMYQKRSGTSGIQGQLYETKLLTLLLIRALNDKDIKTFHLGTNIANIGAFDDLVFRYNLNNSERPGAIFIQAKHKENPQSDNVTVKEVLKEEGDLSIYKYLNSYLKIKYNFNPNNSDPVFKGNFQDVDCEFIIYTPAEEKFDAQKLKVVRTTSKECLMKTNDSGKVFLFDYNKLDDDVIASLNETVRVTRIKLLAKRFMLFVLKDNHTNMITDDLIKTFHVFLAENVIKVSNANTSNGSFLTYEFRKNFFSSDDYLLTILRETIFEAIIHLYGKKKSLQTEEIIEILKSIPKKVPKQFGNLNFHVEGNDRKRERRLNYVSRILEKLIKNADKCTNIIIIDDNMVGPNEILNGKDIETYRIGGLVGNLLIFDDNENMLKFTKNYKTLSTDAITVYEKLKELTKLTDKDLIKYRFDINVNCFPRLTLHSEEHDKHMITSFLSSLTFYTNQAQENIVEEIIKKEIKKLYNTQDNYLFRIKCKAFFLEVHDKVQRWWKEKPSAPYLEEDCKFFTEARKDIINSPLLTILNSLYTKSINKFQIQFNETAIQTLNFIHDSKERLLNIIITDEIGLTSIKLLQYFKINCCDSTYTFVDLDFVIEQNYFDTFISELKELRADNFILIFKEHNNIKYFNENLKIMVSAITKNFFLITHSVVASEIMLKHPSTFIKKTDGRNRLSDLDFESPNTKKLLEENITFQGEEVSLKVIVNDETSHLVNSEVLSKLINGNKIELGRPLTKSIYTEIKAYYENQNICGRYIQLKKDEIKPEIFNVIKSNETINIKENKDIVLLSNEEEKYYDLCHKFKRSCNIHWFILEGENYTWKQTEGTLTNILKYVNRTLNDTHLREIETIKDIDEKIIIIGADPGMGKSTLLNHVSIKTKTNYPFIWIANISLRDYNNEFDRWQESEIDVKTEAKKLLCTALCHSLKEKEERINENQLLNEALELVTTKEGTNVRLKSDNVNDINGLALLEIELFNHYYNKGEIAVLLDGFDEICPDYMNEVMQLIEFLKSNIKHLWITTRPYNIILNQLEAKLGTFSYNLQLWTTPKQNSFLVKYFIQKLRLDVRDCRKLNRLKFFCDQFYNTIHVTINNKNRKNNFTDIPLHIFMIAEIFQDSFKSYYKTGVKKLSYKYKKEIVETLNLITLYEKFVDVKFYTIRYGEKKPSLDCKDPDTKKTIEKERKEFIENHKKLAAYSLFNKNLKENKELLSDEDIIEIHNLMEIAKKGGEKTGIINEIIGNDPKFVHFTFAEYFATEFLCDKLKRESCSESLWIYLIDTVLVEDHEGIRIFFNNKLETKDQEFLNACRNTKHNDAIFNQLLMQSNQFMGNTSLYIAVEESLENIAIFLLNALKTILNKDNLDNFIRIIVHCSEKSCVFCAAVTKGSKNIINTIISCITDINSNKLIDIFKCIPDCGNNSFAKLLCGKLENKAEIIELLLRNMRNNTDIVALFEIPNLPIHTLGFLINNDKESVDIVIKYLKRLNKNQLWRLFSATDICNRTTAHYAMAANDIKFFAIMKSLLNTDQFNKICLAKDMNGKYPMLLLMTNLCLNVGDALSGENLHSNITPENFFNHVFK